jgi:hypothetical protein
MGTPVIYKEIIIKIPSSKFDEFKTGFNKAIPRPEAFEHLTDEQFIKQYIKDFIFRAYKTGKMIKAKETTKPVIDDNILEVI